MTPADESTAITLDQLLATWHVLTAMAKWYEPAGDGWIALSEARQLVEVEIREQHGYEAWKRVIGSVTS